MLVANHPQGGRRTFSCSRHTNEARKAQIQREKEEIMQTTRIAAAVALLLCLEAPKAANAAMYVIENPASKISNPADKMYNPANQPNNPAATIYNPGSRMDNPNPVAPPNPPPAPTARAATPTAAPTATATPEKQRQRPEVAMKRYAFKTASAYLQAAKKAFANDDYPEFISLAEDALRRINAGTLKASAKNRLKLQKYRTFGYGLLD
jgi:type IV secretory pathway VirB10-like protein